MVGIYRYTNLINGKRYIGQSNNLEHRIMQHYYTAVSKTKKSLLERAISKYGIENFRIEILEFCSEDQLDELEEYWIDYYCTCIYREDGLGYGYNIRSGGKQSRGFKGHTPWNKGKTNVYTEEQKKRISEGTKKAMQDDIHRENYLKAIKNRNISGENNGFYGKHHTEETKNKIRDAKKGRKASDEVKLLYSKQRLNRKWMNNTIQECFVKPELIQEYLDNNFTFGRLKKNIIV